MLQIVIIFFAFGGERGVIHILLENILHIMPSCICSLAVELWFLTFSLLRISDTLFKAPGKVLLNLLIDGI